MRIRKLESLNPLTRWRWDAAGMFGYAATQRAAARAAREALMMTRPTREDNR